MPLIRPTYVDTVTHIPADWANAVTALLFDVFGLAANPSAARNALGLGTLAMQSADAIQITGGSINNVPIGLNVPMQGRFTVLSLESDPIAPEHGVNKRYLEQRLSQLGSSYLPITGGTMQGALTLAGDPVTGLDAVPKRYLTAQLTTNIGDKAIQRKRWTASSGQTVFEWPEFVRPAQTWPDNMVMFKDRGFLQYSYDYAVLMSQSPRITLAVPATTGQIIDAMYLNNLNNLLAVEISPPSAPFDAAAGWADPVNLRIGYALNNSGENAISTSSTMLRHLYMQALVVIGTLGDRAISWVGQWMPANTSSVPHPPTIQHVSTTEAVVVLPENVANNEFFWEGRYEITMYVDGVPTGPRLWCDMNNQAVPNLTDGLVRWGTMSTVLPLVITPEIQAGCFTTATMLIDGGARTDFSLANTNGQVSITFTNNDSANAATVIAPQTIPGLDLPFGWSEAFPVVAPNATKTITALYHVSATTPRTFVFDFLGCPGPITKQLTA